MNDISTNKDLFVSDISFNAAEEDLQKLFAICGTVRSIHLINDRVSGQFKGCAFVCMSTASEARDALNMLDGARLVDRCIRIKPARPKKAKTPVSEQTQEKPQRTRRSPKRK